MVKKKENLFEFPRPMDNENLVGHADTLRAFLDAWARRDSYPIHPVWILAGPRGIGKATLAYRLARRVFSDLMGRSESDIAAQMSVGGIGDLFVVDMEHNLAASATAKTISVDTVRAMIDKLRLSSMAESWRVVIIDSLDELSDKTPNALLKTLEEPPAKTIFFLISHSLDRTLPTIRSRARVEKLRPLSGMELREIAARLMPGHEIEQSLIRIAAGSFGRVASLISSGAASLFDEIMTMLESPSTNSADCLAAAKKLAKNPENMSILADVAAARGQAWMYPTVLSAIERMNLVHLDPETTAFRIIGEMRK